MFPEYTIKEINNAIMTFLSNEHKNIVFKMHDGDLYNNANKDNLTNSELNIYRKIITRITKALNGEEKIISPKRSNPKRPKTFYEFFPDYSKIQVDKFFKELTDIRKNAVLKRHDGNLDNIQDFKIKLSKNESGAYAEAINFISDKLSEYLQPAFRSTDYDENEVYLKLQELLQTRYFMDALMSLNADYAMIMILKIKNPTKTAKEISDFTNIPYETVVKILSKGLDIIIKELEKLFKGLFTDSDNIKPSSKRLSKDN